MKTFYDNKPKTLEADGNGAYRYRWDIQITNIQNGDDTQALYQCNEVTVYMPLSTNKITAAVINELWEHNQEQKLINEYNAAQLGVYSETVAQKKIEQYKNFLKERQKIKDMVDKDCGKISQSVESV